MDDAINPLIRKFKKAKLFMENPNVTDAEKEKYLIPFVDLVREIGILTQDMSVAEIDKMMNDAEVEG